MSGSATKGHLGKTVFGNDKNGGREAISGGRKLQEDRFTSSIWQMQRVSAVERRSNALLYS